MNEVMGMIIILMFFSKLVTDLNTKFIVYLACLFDQSK